MSVFEFSDRTKKYQAELLDFMDKHVYPAEAVYEEQMRESGNPHFQPPIIDDLKKEAKARGRGYYPSDLEMLSSLGAASGYLSVMVLALYIQDGHTVALYRHPEFIWLSCPLLLFWVSRTWMLTHRGEMHDDPVVFAIKDKVNLVVGLLFGGRLLPSALSRRRWPALCPGGGSGAAGAYQG